MTDASNTSTAGSDATALPQETVDFAHRIFDAARNDQSELLLAAVDAGLPVNLTNEKGNTLLMLTAYSGHLELTKQLLERKADPNRLNDNGQSIVAGCVFKGHDDIVRFLVERGADVRLGKPNAIQTAHMFGRQDLMELLGARDGDIDASVPTPIGPPA